MLSLQLSVRGRPTAWDLSPGNEMCVVAAPGCMTFFHLNGLGAPRHVIHYEQPQQVRQVRYQRLVGSTILAALRGGVVSLWDPSKSLRPLVGFVQSSSPGSYLTDMQWSSGNSNLLATGSDCGGDVCIWDIRTPSWPVQQMHQPIGSVCSNLDWCPSSSNLLASSNNHKVFVWDIRMSSQSSDGGTGGAVFSIEPHGQGVGQCVWSNGDEGEPSLIIGTTSGTVEWWNIQTSKDGFTGNSRRDRSLKLSNIDSTSMFLPTPTGKSVLVHKQISDDNSSSVSIDIQGYPRDGYSLEKVFSPPDPDGFGDGPSLRVVACKDPILGMKWGTPGRLVPPSHAGLELLFLTESAALHAIKIPVDVVKHCSNTGHNGYSTVASPNNSLEILAKAAKVVTNNRKANVINTGNESQDNIKPIAAPKYRLVSLKKTIPPLGDCGKRIRKVGVGNSISNVIRSSDISTDDQSNSRSDFWTFLRKDVLRLEHTLQQQLLEGISIGRIDEHARQITLEMSLLEKPSVSLNRNIDSSGLIVEENKSKDNDSIIASLIISFPNNFPVNGLPNFAVRASMGSETALNAELTAIAHAALLPSNESALPIQDIGIDGLDNNLEGFSTLRFGSGFFLDIARCFRNRVLQSWNKKANPINETVPIKTWKDFSDTENMENTDEILKDKEDSSKINPVDVINPKDYRIPCPASSGGGFSSSGTLFCFGGAILHLGIHSTSSQRIIEGSSVNYQKTLADYLIAERAKEEAIISSTNVNSMGLAASFMNKKNRVNSTLNSRRSNEDISDSADVESSGEDSVEIMVDFDDQSEHNYSLLSSTQEKSNSNSYNKNKRHEPSSLESYLGTNVLPIAVSNTGESLETLGLNLDMIEVAMKRENSNHTDVGRWQATSTLTSESSFRRISLYKVTDSLSQILAFRYSLGPLPNIEDFEATGKDGIDQSRSHIWRQRAEACKHNALISDSISYSRTVQQTWSLLAVSLDLLSASIGSEAGFTSSSSTMISWKSSVLGNSLLCRIIVYLVQLRDIQTLSTVICVLGGSAQTVYLLNYSSKSSNLGLSFPITTSYLERLLWTYSDVLSHWSALLQAAEVKKRIIFINIFNDFLNLFY
jgi:hypothetical protein